MIMKCDQVFMVCACMCGVSPLLCMSLWPHTQQEDDEVWIAQVKEEAQQRRQKPQKPVPYSVYMENLTSLEEVCCPDLYNQLKLLLL